MPTGKTLSGIRALLLHELAGVARSLGDQADPHHGVHEARKAIRRLRSILAMVDADAVLGSGVDAALARLCDSLSALRDGDATVETAMRLAMLGDSAEWQPAVDALRSRSERSLDAEFAGDPGFASRRAAIDTVRRRIEAADWNDVGHKALQRGIARQRRRVLRAARRAMAEPTAENLHRWRRRVRRLRMQLGALGQLRGLPAEITAGPRSATSGKQLARLARDLGWVQDLYVLGDALRRLDGLSARETLLDDVAAQLCMAQAWGWGRALEQGTEGRLPGEEVFASPRRDLPAEGIS